MSVSFRELGFLGGGMALGGLIVLAILLPSSSYIKKRNYARAYSYETSTATSTAGDASGFGLVSHLSGTQGQGQYERSFTSGGVGKIGDPLALVMGVGFMGVLVGELWVA